MVETIVTNLMLTLTARFESFEESTQDMWDNISYERFRSVEAMIKSYHTTIGGELCSLSVKMDAWKKLFPSKRAGGPARRADFILTEIRQGIDKIREIEESAPKLAKKHAPESKASSDGEEPPEKGTASSNGVEASEKEEN
jgi:hypothetical protein